LRVFGKIILTYIMQETGNLPTGQDVTPMHVGADSGWELKEESSE